MSKSIKKKISQGHKQFPAWGVPIFIEESVIDFPFCNERVEMNNRARFICLDCRTNTDQIKEYYMVKDNVWFAVAERFDGMLCVGCLEARLGRELNSADFTDCPLNNDNRTPGYASARLFDRIQRVHVSHGIR